MFSIKLSILTFIKDLKVLPTFKAKLKKIISVFLGNGSENFRVGRHTNILLFIFYWKKV